MPQLSYQYLAEDKALPVLVLLHGLFGSSTNWMSIARSLSDDYRVLIPDLRNHGDSFHHPDISYSVMADDLWSLFDDLAISQAILVGHSMGGKVAMSMAMDRPEKVAGLAVIDIAPVSYEHDFSEVFAAFNAVDLAALTSRQMADGQMAGVIDDAAVRGFLLQNLQRRADRWQWRINISALEQAMQGITAFDVPAATYTGVASFIYGSRSDYVLPQYQKDTEAMFPQADYCQVQNAGHWVYAEQPKAFMRCLQRFLTKVD